MNTSPTDFSPDLTDERLSIISRLLLNARYSALEHASTELDDRYTKGSLSFGRQRQAILQAATNKNKDLWLTLSYGGMDVLFKIGTIPVRFFTDDSYTPKKPRVSVPTIAESLQLDIFEPNDTEILLWRFIIEASINDDGDDVVYFIGLNKSHEIICRWKFEDSVRVLHSIDNTTPPEKELTPATITPKTDDNKEKRITGDV